MGVTMTIREVPGGGFPIGFGEDGELKRYSRKTNAARPLRMYGKRDRRLRRRYVDERGVYGCGCEVLRGYGNCIIVVANGGLVDCAGSLFVSMAAGGWDVVARCIVSLRSTRVQGSISQLVLLIAYKALMVENSIPCSCVVQPGDSPYPNPVVQECR